MSTVVTTSQYHVELIDGREIEKPLPKKLHVFIQRFLILELTRLLPGSYVSLPELNVLTGSVTREGRREYIVPDVTVVAAGMKYEDGDLAQPPLWGVEILSPGQTIDDLFVRAGRLLKLGSPLAWVIWPEKRKAWEYRTDDLIQKQDALLSKLPTGEEIRVEIAPMWAELDRF
jgi:Uma2 family endonuclease